MFGTDLGGFRLTGWQNLDELLRFRDEHRARVPGEQLLLIIDDHGQAAYTAGHSMEANGLKEVDESALSDEERVLFEEHFRLTPQRWADTVVPALRTAALETTLVFGQQLTPIDNEDIDLLAMYDDLGGVIQEPLECAVIASDQPSMAIAALPNGYFQGDLSPMDNYLLAEKLRTDFGYEIVGLGAMFVLYARDEPVGAELAAEVVGAVRDLYAGMTADLAAAWVAKLTGLRWLLLSYSGA